MDPYSPCLCFSAKFSTVKPLLELPAPFVMSQRDQHLLERRGQVETGLHPLYYKVNICLSWDHQDQPGRCRVSVTACCSDSLPACPPSGTRHSSASQTGPWCPGPGPEPEQGSRQTRGVKVKHTHGGAQNTEAGKSRGPIFIFTGKIFL